MTELIDFDLLFVAYLKESIPDIDKLKEEAIDEVALKKYDEWKDTCFDCLGGTSPAGFFKQTDNPGELILRMKDYIDSGMNPPELLLDAISDFGPSAEPFLLDALKNMDEREGFIIEVIGLLTEIGSSVCEDALIEIVCAKKGDLAEKAASALEDMEISHIDKLIEALKKADTEASERLLDIMSLQKADERIFKILIEKFENDIGNRNLHAYYLEKYGDERAVPILEEAVKAKGIDYLSFCVLRDAIEALGGEIGQIPDFDGDKDFEALSEMKRI